MGAVTEAGARLHAAEDMADFERAGRTLQTACRNLRQTIAMKQRFDRERAAQAAERRRGDEAERLEGERARDLALGRHRKRVRGHFERVLWTEYEDDDAQEMFAEVDERLFELSDDAAFLETPVETLIARLTEECGVGVHADAPHEDTAEEAPDDAAPEDAAAEPIPPPSGEAAAQPTEAGLYDSSPDPVAEAAPPEPEPPPRPPDPPPYIPPWEQLRPGQIMRGGGGGAGGVGWLGS